MARGIFCRHSDWTAGRCRKSDIRKRTSIIEKTIGDGCADHQKYQWKRNQRKSGSIFKGHNIIEYKSPDDSFSIDDFYKVIAYAGLYKSDVETADSIKAEDINITFVAKSYPRKMIEHIRAVQNLEVREYAKEFII